MGHPMVKQIAYIYINILYVEHYIYNNVEYYMCIYWRCIYIWVEPIKLLIITERYNKPHTENSGTLYA